MATLSVCMIVRDEEEIIDRCLSSFQEIADEIIIVDTGSKDRTVEIAKKYPQVRVEHFTWIDDFGSARNHSFRYATKDLIMWVDADDIIKPVDVQRIKRLKEQDLSQLPDCFVCKYQYNHDHLNNVTISLKRERIFKRSSNPTWKYRIHECIPLGAFRTIEYNCPIEIHHYKTSKQYQRAEGRNIKILRECVEDHAQNCARYEFYLGKELSELNNPEAEKYLKRYLQHPEYFEDQFYATFRLAHLSFNRKDFDQATNYCFDALKIDQRRGDVYCFLGLIFINKQRHDLAKFWYKVAIMMPRPEDSLGFFDESQHTYVPHAQLSYVSYLTGDFEGALLHADEALKFRPDDGMAQHNRTMALQALKKDTEPRAKKIAIYIPFNYDINNPNIRLRKVNIQKEFRKKDIEADIVKNFSDLSKYDYILTHSLFSEPELMQLKNQGKIIGYDLAEGWFDQHFHDTVKHYNIITCSSSKLKNYCSKLNINAVHIPDSFEAV